MCILAPPPPHLEFVPDRKCFYSFLLIFFFLGGEGLALTLEPQWNPSLRPPPNPKIGTTYRSITKTHNKLGATLSIIKTTLDLALTMVMGHSAPDPTFSVSGQLAERYPERQCSTGL